MPSIYDLKQRFQALLKPVVAWLARAGVSANAVTVAAALTSVALGLLMAVTQVNWLLLVYPPFLLLRMAMNAIDGMLAREFSQPTPLGAILNEIGDMTSDAVLYLPLALLLPAPAWLMVAIVAVALIAEGAGIAAVAVGAGRRYDGPFGKSDRALAFSVLAIVVALDAFGVDRWAVVALSLLLVLAVLTVFNRVRGALAEIR